MKTMFRTISYSYDIEPVEVYRETEKSVWLKDNRYNKTSEFYQFFETFENAKKHLVDKAEKKVQNCEYQLKTAEVNLLKALSLKIN